MKNEGYKVQKPLNNNVVIAENHAGNEVMFIGKGIGFGMKQGDPFEATSYDKVYSLIDVDEQEKYRHLLAKESEETLLIIHESIANIQDEVGFQLDESVHFALTQHLALALQRTRDATDIQNPFLTETKWLYYDTYQIAERAVAFIADKTGMRLPEAEVGFVTLHIQSSMHRETSSQSQEQEIISRSLAYIEEKLALTINEYNPALRRVVQHLKQMIDDPLPQGDQCAAKEYISVLKEEVPLCYNVTRNIMRMIEKTMDTSLSEWEAVQFILYLKILTDVSN
ncbi:PRD domain-containing protein [Salisediminibacterium halotolerans]|uniref:Transcriptional antiterminator n=1 Tax=Salisediminibacterium halotolerans TaxID=517425 RepID=A0A1H9U215_9BACI|nr:PRD domain-containing protein [Salisediminibacterium haloalkalitolerans]SES03535.1 transcriptional antiterminator [Salisediminibacterium haloalkalitolerans]